MARAKPRYTGSPTLGEKPADYTQALRDSLRSIYPEKEAVVDDVWGHPADGFVSEILAQADWAVSELYEMGSDISVEELKLEHADLIDTLTAAESKLRTISPDLDRLIAEADPLGCADHIKQMITHAIAAEPLIRNLPRAKRPEQKKAPIALEITVRILSVIEEKYGIHSTAWVAEYNEDKTSKTIQILKSIGDEIGLDYSPQTWRRILRDAKEIIADDKKKRSERQKGDQLTPSTEA